MHKVNPVTSFARVRNKKSQWNKHIARYSFTLSFWQSSSNLIPSSNLIWSSSKFNFRVPHLTSIWFPTRRIVVKASWLTYTIRVLWHTGHHVLHKNFVFSVHQKCCIVAMNQLCDLALSSTTLQPLRPRTRSAVWRLLFTRRDCNWPNLHDPNILWIPPEFKALECTERIEPTAWQSFGLTISHWWQRGQVKLASCCDNAPGMAQKSICCGSHGGPPHSPLAETPQEGKMWSHRFPAIRKMRRRGSTAARPVPRGSSDQRSRHGSSSHQSRGGNLCSPPSFFFCSPLTPLSWPGQLGLVISVSGTLPAAPRHRASRPLPHGTVQQS